MARSSRVDPLEKFRFTLSWSADGDSEGSNLSRAGFHDVQLPKRSTNIITYREGIDPDINQLAPGLSSMDPIVLNRGLIIDDLNNEMYKWMSAVHNPTAGHEGRAAVQARKSDAAADKYRKDVTVSMLDREGNVARRWVLHQAWPSNFVPGSDLDASEDGDKSLESLTLSYEDFQEVKKDSNEKKEVSSEY